MAASSAAAAAEAAAAADAASAIAERGDSRADCSSVVVWSNSTEPRAETGPLASRPTLPTGVPPAPPPVARGAESTVRSAAAAAAGPASAASRVEFTGAPVGETVVSLLLLGFWGQHRP